MATSDLANGQTEAHAVALSERLEKGSDRVEVALVALGHLPAQGLLPRGVGPELDQHRHPARVSLRAAGHLPRHRAQPFLQRRRADDGLRIGALPSGSMGVVHRQEQLVLAGEVGVDRALGVARALADLLQRGAMEAGPQEDLPSRRHQVRPGAFPAVLPVQPLHSDTSGIRYRWYSDTVSMQMSRALPARIAAHYRPGLMRRAAPGWYHRRPGDGGRRRWGMRRRR